METFRQSDIKIRLWMDLLLFQNKKLFFISRLRASSDLMAVSARTRSTSCCRACGTRGRLPATWRTFNRPLTLWGKTSPKETSTSGTSKAESLGYYSESCLMWSLRMLSYYYLLSIDLKHFEGRQAQRKLLCQVE
jgi:hypothetical protein